LNDENIQYNTPTAKDAKACSIDVFSHDREYQYPYASTGTYKTTDVTTPGEYLRVLSTARMWKPALKRMIEPIESQKAIPFRTSRTRGRKHKATKTVLIATRYFVVILEATDWL